MAKPKTVYVWRLEWYGVWNGGKGWMGVFHSGRGYMPGALRYDEHNNDIDPCRHPTPSDEGLPWGPEWFCCFRNLAQFRLWFCTSKQRKLLEKRGVVLKKYRIDASDVRMGKSQSMFRREFAKLIEERSPAFADPDVELDPDW